MAGKTPRKIGETAKTFQKISMAEDGNIGKLGNQQGSYNVYTKRVLSPRLTVTIHTEKSWATNDDTPSKSDVTEKGPFQQTRKAGSTPQVRLRSVPSINR